MTSVGEGQYQACDVSGGARGRAMHVTLVGEGQYQACDVSGGGAGPGM